MRSKVSKDGRVTLPARIRRYLRLGPGTPVVFDVMPNGTVVMRRANLQQDRPPNVDRFSALRGTASSGMSTDDVMRLTRGGLDLPD